MAIVTECPVCEFQGRVADEEKGKEINCKGCGTPFTVPNPTGAADSTAVETPSIKLTTADGPIATQCPGCGTKGKVPPQFAGKKVKCPKCANQFVVPAPQVSAPPPAPAASGPAARLGDTTPTEEPENAEIKLTDIDGAEVVEESSKEEPAYEVIDDLAIVIDTVCPRCRFKGTVPEKFLGKKVKCRKCSEMFVVTDSSKSAPKVAAKPAPAPAPVEVKDDPFSTLNHNTPPAESRKEPPKSVPKQKKPQEEQDEPAPSNNHALVTIVGSAVLLVVLAGLIGAFLFFTKKNGTDTDKPIAQVTATDQGEHKAVPPPSKEPERKVNAPDPKPRDVKPNIDKATPPKPPADVVKNVPPDQPVKPSEPDPMPPAKVEAPTQWLDASKEAAKVGEVSVRVTAAWVDIIKSPAHGPSRAKHLMIQIQIENQNAEKVISYKGWGTDPRLPSVLSDNLGKNYKRSTAAEVGFRVDGQVQTEQVAPGKVLDDLLIFEAVSGPVEYLRLELPAANLGGTGTLGMQIPGNMIVFTKAPTKEPVVAKGDKVQTLRSQLKDASAAKRMSAVKQLGEMAADAAPAVPELTGALRDKDEMIRAAAAETLGKIGPGAKSSINALIGALRDEYWKVKANACEALGNFGADAKDAVPMLQKLMASKDDEVPQKAALALSKIDARLKLVPKKK